MRNTPTRLSGLLVISAGLASAFPFQVGRPMEYSVLRRSGAESAIVTLVALDTARDTGGTNWRIEVKDSLTGGVRANYTKRAVQIDTSVLRVQAGAMFWRDGTCVIPWDLSRPDDNLIPSVKRGGNTLSWGGLSLVCAGALGGPGVTGYSYSDSRTVQKDALCDESKLSCMSFSYSRRYPAIEGLWKDDSGWISYQDGVPGDAWRLVRIGNQTPEIPADRFLSKNWLSVRSGDRWNWKVIHAWVLVPEYQLVKDTIRGADTTAMVWIALERLGDSGVVGTWKFQRQTTGPIASTDTVVVEFDSPLSQAEPLMPSDLNLMVFRRGASPSWYSEDSIRSYKWNSTTIATSARDSRYTERRYEFSKSGGVAKMVQRIQKGPWASGGSGLNVADSTLTILLSSYEPGPVTPASIAARMEPNRDRIESLRELESFLEQGGQILVIADLRGKIASAPVNLMESLRSAHGLAILQLQAPSGHRFTTRLLLP